MLNNIIIKILNNYLMNKEYLYDLIKNFSHLLRIKYRKPLVITMI